MDTSPPNLSLTGSNAAELDRVQRWMLAVITHPDGVQEGARAEEAIRWIANGAANLESVVTPSRKLSAAERLAIYGNAYYARLLDCLGEVYPVLKRTLGEELFNGFAFGYLQNYPSRSYTLHHLGRHFASYLRETRPEPSDSDPADGDQEDGWMDFLIDLARLEWAIYEVFDGPGLENDPPMDFPDFHSIAQRDWLDLKFRTAPCLQLLAFDYPVNDHFTAVRQCEGALEVEFPRPRQHYLAISRREYIVRRFPLDEVQFALLAALQQGTTLGKALEACLDVAERAGEELRLDETLPHWFYYWSSEHCFFTGIQSAAQSCTA